MTAVIRILTFALPVVIVIATLEGLLLAFVMRRSYNWRACFASLPDALGRQYVVVTFLSLSLAAPAYDLAYNHRLFAIPIDTTVTVVHHAANPEYLDHNYGGCSSFSTASSAPSSPSATICRAAMAWCSRFVPITPSSSPFMNGWRSFAICGHARSWRDRWFYLFGPPGWQPDGAAARIMRKGPEMDGGQEAMKVY